VVKGEVVAADGDGLRVRADSRREVPAPQPEFVLVQALPKGDRGPLAVDLATELGVDRIVPWTAARCVTRWRDDRVEKGLAKWRGAPRGAPPAAPRPRPPPGAGPPRPPAVGWRLCPARPPPALARPGPGARRPARLPQRRPR